MRRKYQWTGLAALASIMILGFSSCGFGTGTGEDDGPDIALIGNWTGKSTNLLLQFTLRRGSDATGTVDYNGTVLKGSGTWSFPWPKVVIELEFPGAGTYHGTFTGLLNNGVTMEGSFDGPISHLYTIHERITLQKE